MKFGILFDLTQLRMFFFLLRKSAKFSSALYTVGYGT